MFHCSFIKYGEPVNSNQEHYVCCTETFILGWLKYAYMCIISIIKYDINQVIIGGLRVGNYFYFLSMLAVFTNHHILLLYRTLVRLCHPSQKCVSTALEITAHLSVVLCRETTLSVSTTLFLGKTTLSVSH